MNTITYEPNAKVNSASQANSSPTNACPFIFAMPKRLFILVKTTFMTN